jgi:FkbM family methyltransferase
MDHHIIKNYFLNSNLEVLKEGVVIECGAATGIYEPSITLEKKYNWKFIGIEPDPEQYKKLCQNRPNAIALNVGLSNLVGESSFFKSAHGKGGNSSIKHNSIHIEELKKYPARINGNIYQEIKIKTINWNHLINQLKINKVNLFILDVEGHELPVLEGLADSGVLPDVIQIEFSYSDPENKLIDKKNKENFSGIIKINKSLNKLGYFFNYVNYNNAFYSRHSFWNGKKIPSLWIGENEKFVWNNVCYFNKNKCLKLLNQ